MDYFSIHQPGLKKIATAIETTLGSNFIGFYVSGSLVMGSWNEKSSDRDFLVVTQTPLSPEDSSALGNLHARLATDKTAKLLEGEYIDIDNLRKKDFTINVGTVVDGHFMPSYPCKLSADNILCFLKYGKDILGKPFKELNVEVSIEELRNAVRTMLKESEKKLSTANDFRSLFGILIDSLRSIYTLRTNDLPTKQAALQLNKDILKKDLFENIDAYLANRIPSFDISNEDLNSLIKYGLNIK